MNAKLSQSNRLWRLTLFAIQNFAPCLILLLVAVALYNWSASSHTLYIPIKEVAVKTVSSGYHQGTDDDDIAEEEDILIFETSVDLEIIDRSHIEGQLIYFMNGTEAEKRLFFNYSDPLR